MERLKINIEISEEILNNRKKLFNDLKDDKRIRDFLSKHNLDLQFLADNIQKFADWIKQLELSEKCKTSDYCFLEQEGYYFDLEYNDILYWELKPCAHQIAKDQQYSFLKNYVIRDFPDTLANVSVSSIFSNKESIEYMNTVVTLASFLENPKGAGYYIYGDIGVGKTYLMSAIANELAKINFKIAFVHTASLANNLRSMISESYSLDKTLYDLKNVDILILDDIGSESVTNWYRDEILLSVLNYRMEAQKSTFFTSNLDFDELQDYYALNNRREYNELAAKRLLDRIRSLSRPIKLVGKNRRQLI